MSTVRIQIRRGTASDWTSVNPVLAAGEAGVEVDTLQIKIGDGTSNWSSLGYATVTPGNLTDAINAALTGTVDVNFATITDLNNAISQEVLDRNTAIGTSLSTAESYTDTAKAQAISTSESYTDTAITNLVNGAPSVLNTLKELADAIADDANFSTTVATHIASAKTDAEAYTDTAISTEVTNRNSAIATSLSTAEGYTDTEISTEVTNRNAAIATELSNRATAVTSAIATAEGYTDSAISTEVTNRNSAISTAKTEAITAAESYADGLASNYDAAGAASAAQTAAQSYANGLASNYDAAGSAGSAQSAAESYADGLVQNGNSSATPTYQALNVGGYTELISGWNSTSTGATFVPVSWNANYGTAKLTVHVRDGVHSQASEVLVARDSANNLAITEYAFVTTNGLIADISVLYSSGTVSLTVSPTAGHTNVEAVASGSVIVWAD